MAKAKAQISPLFVPLLAILTAIMLVWILGFYKSAIIGGFFALMKVCTYYLVMVTQPSPGRYVSRDETADGTRRGTLHALEDKADSRENCWR